jgi:DNA-binding MarR family transcriptional regulator
MSYAPRLSPRPLLATEADQSLFIDREDETSRIMKALASSLNTLVVGEAGIGKSSLLHHVESRLRLLERPAVFVRGEPESDLAGLLERVEAGLRERPGPAPEERPTPRVDHADAFTTLERIGRLVSDSGPIYVLLDGVPPAPVGHELFGRLRDELWELPLTWVVTVRPADAQALQTPPADAFFSDVIRLRPLSADAALRLIDVRMGGEGQVAGTVIAELAGGVPRLALEIARQILLDGVDPERLRERVQARERRLDELSDAQMRLFTTLEQLGPVSASDQALLRELGWSRPRASIVLRQLEELGLVAAASAPTSTGRPKKVYALAER